MQPEPGSPQQWLTYARSDLALARIDADQDVLFASLCFHAQQAVEKSIKAVLVFHGIAFPRIHSIERLTDMLPDCVCRTKELMDSAALSAYATVFRYPGVDEPVTEELYREAVRLAEAAVRWAEKSVKS